jgi:leucyl aminopeptidase
MIEIVTGGPEGADLLVVPVLVDRTPATGSVHAPDLEALRTVLDARDFTGKAGQQVFLQTPEGPTPEVLLIGVGDEIDDEAMRRAAGTAARAARRYATVATLLHDVDLDGAVDAVVVGTHLGAYTFDEYRSEPKERRFATLVLVDADGADEEIAAANALARGVILARDLVNRPALDKPPAAIADIATGLSRDIAVTVYDEQAIAEKGFGGLEAVNRGADRPARMVVMEYRPDGAARTVAFVGKGIVFDSGGLSIKPIASMESMKTDMAGAAAVMGAIKVVADRGLPVNVIGITPLTENLIGGSAQRPGDVMRAYNGKTIEVLNTDAEGRLVLADGLSLAAEASPDLIVDIATLTGSCKSALGTAIAGLFARDDDAADVVVEAAKAAGEKVWRLPIDPEYRSLIESDIADMKNTGGPWGGAIIAALILAEFVGDTPWVHLDIAGPARADANDHYISKGGSGFGVRTLVAVAEAMAG